MGPCLPKRNQAADRLLARWKGNQYYFYSEASIALDGYPLLNPQGRFTKDSVRRIIAYGRERHVELFLVWSYMDTSTTCFESSAMPTSPCFPMALNLIPAILKSRRCSRIGSVSSRNYSPAPSFISGSMRPSRSRWPLGNWEREPRRRNCIIEQLNAVAQGF